MGCKCYEKKRRNNTNNNLQNDTITSNMLTKKKNNEFNQKEEQDKITSLSSINSGIDLKDNNKAIRTPKKKDIYKIKNGLNVNANNIQKNNLENNDFSLKNSFLQSRSNNFADSPNKEKMPSNREYICNIHKIDHNNNNISNNKKYVYKHSQNSPMKSLINMVKNEEDIKNSKKNIFLYYKGNRINENDTIYNIINKKDNQIDNILNNNNINKQKDINEIDFDAVSFSIKDEGEDIEEKNININGELMLKQENNSFSSIEFGNDKNEKKKINNKINSKKEEKEKEISRQLMFKLSPICKKHNKEHLIYICITCYNSFCILDFKEHKNQFKNHEIIPKSKLIELNYEIKKIKGNILDIYKEIFPELYTSPLSPGPIPDQKDNKAIENDYDNDKINYISSNKLFSKLKIALNDINEQLESLYDSYRHSYYKMNSKFLALYEEKMPKIIEYDEYIGKTLTNGENLNIYSNENEFIDNYNNCLNITNTSHKYYQNIIALKDIIFKYKEFLELFHEKGKELIEYVQKGIDDIMKFKNGDKIFNLNGGFLQFKEKSDITNRNNNFNNIIESKDSKNFNNISLITNNKDLNQKISLKFLLSEKKNKLSKSMFNTALSKTISNNNLSNGCSILKKKKSINFFKEKNSVEKINFNKRTDLLQKDEKETEIKPNEIELKSPSNLSSKGQIKLEVNSSVKDSSSNTHSDLVQRFLICLLYGTKDIIQYISKSKKINIFTPDISILKIKKFESYISSINYKNRFYISGGYSTSKQFFEYDIKNNKFIKLPEMLSNHYYHTMIGNNNCIYSISGFKSKKIEKYNIYDKNWKSLPDLAFERTYPNALIYNNNLFVFGKINNPNVGENDNIIEYLNITENNNIYKWNQIKISEQLPFNSGVLLLDKNDFLLVGGKMDPNGNSINSCYSMTIKINENKYNIDVKLEDIKLEQESEFNGNNFSSFDENNSFYGLFSSNNPYFLYIYNKNTNCFTYIQSDNKE